MISLLTARRTRQPPAWETAEAAAASRTRQTLIHNERTKLLASAIDRVSTGFLTVGIATPLAARLFYATHNLPDWYYIAAMVVFAGIGVLLHAVARHLLGGLR
jgi:uncharacterized membrane protein